MTKTIMIAAALFSLSAPAMSAEPVTIRVPTAGIDLATSEGRAALTQRAERIASDQCGTASAADRNGRATVKECRETVVAAVQRHAASLRMADAER